MKKILCLIDSLASGGAERQMSYLSAGLCKAGHEVLLVVFSQFSDFYREYAESQGVRVETNLRGYDRFRRILEIRKLVRSYKPDAVICYKDGVNIAACMARMLTPFRLIVSERNTTQSLSKYEKLKFALYRFADKIVPNSFSQANFIKQHYPALDKKVKVITNTIDTGYFSPKKTPESLPAHPVVLTTARVMPQKNVLRYLDAVALVHKAKPALKFLWVGFNADSYFEDVKRKRAELGLEDVIEFRDAQKDIADVYRAADFYCLPSIYEGFPNVVCEAMSCGLPVVCSNVCDNPYIVQDGINGLLFNPEDPADMASKILSLTDMPVEELGKMSENNSRRIEKLCSPETFISEYNSII